MLLILKRSSDREAELQRFLREVHISGSTQYHHWLTPDEFGVRFGPADADTQTVVGWLQSHGFTVPRVTKSRNFIEFSGTAAQVREALHTQIHEYSVNGETRYSIAEEVAIPEALAPLIRGFAPLNNFPLDKYVHAVGPAAYSPSTRRVTPQFTTTVGTKTFYAVAPEDFATQYNLGPIYKTGIDGTGQTIGILGDANINLELVDAYRSLFHLPADNTQVVIDGEDPGPQLGPNIEGFLDVAVSGSVAPKATINLYIAGGTPFQSPLALAALRAIEDDQASILSASFGECEQLLGQSGNQFWSALWEQAAAQGQTVFVSSSDSGPSTCPLGLISGEVVAHFGLNVNGLSSTPWNVSVGGTDFYYSDYASGAPSAATLWNQTNNSSLGSLTAPLQEQPWDNVFGFNAIPFVGNFISIPSPAGGGGASNCAQSNPPPTPPGPPVCVSGYAKPGWQNAPGVPPDGVRDLPDVSLFAANGKNLSAYPICANAGDCAQVTTGEPQVFLVGGTSASSPAMAGIMALVNQKTGSRQGQADFVFYALARQMPSVFHDITIGTNNTLCETTSPDCNSPGPAGLSNIGSYGVCAAGPGYNLASGLGSVDGNALVNNWSEITFLPTTTTLQLSPSTVVHGSPVSVGVSVAPSSASSSIPSGDVNLATTAAVPLPQSGALSLANGSANVSVNFFPGGTYQVTAQYAGDGVFAGSSSSAATLTVTPEPSSTNLTLRYLYFDYSTVPPTEHTGTVTNGGQVPFGSEWSFEAEPTGLNSGSRFDATGTVTFTDVQTSAQASVNSSGIAAWSPQLLTVGSHSVTASYSGDGSYNSSTSSPLSFTVVQGTPQLLAVPDATEVITNGNPPSYQAGSALVVHVLLGSVNSIAPPTGNVTVTLGSQSHTLPLTANAYINQGLSTAFVTFPNVAQGVYMLSASYAGDANWNSTTYTYPTSLTFAPMNSIPTTTTLTLTPASVTSTGAVTFTVTVQANPPGGTILAAPFGFVSLFANGTIFADVIVETPVPGNPLASSGVVVVPGSAIPGGALQIIANFGGDPPSLAPSISAPIALTVTPVDFSMSLGASRVVIPSGQSATVPILLGGPNGGSVALSLACTPSSSRIGCMVNPTSSFSGNTSSTLTINAFVPSSTAHLLPGEGISPGVLLASTSFISVFGILFVSSERKRWPVKWMGLAIVAVALATFAIGCAGSSNSAAPPPPTNVNTPPGSYTLLVTGTSSGVVHNAKMTVIIQ
jgi:hypothetical protein